MTNDEWQDENIVMIANIFEIHVDIQHSIPSNGQMVHCDEYEYEYMQGKYNSTIFK